jgi:exo-beta-1,3-glucanase (GH17 family)
MNQMSRTFTAAILALAVAGVASASDEIQKLQQSPDDLLQGEVMAVSYSGFREGQHPDRGDGAVNPSGEEILEDLQILLEHDLKLIRMYDSDSNTQDTLRIIRENNLPIKVALGIWLDAEISNHEGCPWLNEPIPDEKLASNARKNEAQVATAIELAKKYSDIVVTVNVGNEALVEWNDHMMPLERVIGFVRQVKDAIEQPVTVAENYDWWRKNGTELAAEVDYLGVHSYPAWEGKGIEEALNVTVEDIESVHAALPGKQIVVFEAGWATIANEFGERASEANQKRYYNEVLDWATKANVTVFFFEAFDEPWKGNPDNPMGAEKHWGLWNVDRTPKEVMRQDS